MPNPLLRASLEDAPIIRLGTYDYFVHPITDGVPKVEPDLFREVTQSLAQRLPAAFDLLLTPEAMGIPLAAALSEHAGRPYSVARKRAYGLPGEIPVAQRTGYGGATLHILGLRPGQRVVLVDDVVSTGGTLRALANACRQAKAHLVQALVAINKDVDLAALGRELGCPIEALVRVRVSQGRLQVQEEPHATARL